MAILRIFRMRFCSPLLASDVFKMPSRQQRAEPAEGLKFNPGKREVPSRGRGTCPLPGEARKLFKYMKLIHETRLFFLIVRHLYLFVYLFFSPKIYPGNCLGCLLGSAGHERGELNNEILPKSRRRFRVLPRSVQ